MGTHMHASARMGSRCACASGCLCPCVCGACVLSGSALLRARGSHCGYPAAAYRVLGNSASTVVIAWVCSQQGLSKGGSSRRRWSTALVSWLSWLERAASYHAVGQRFKPARDHVAQVGGERERDSVSENPATVITEQDVFSKVSYSFRG